MTMTTTTACQPTKDSHSRHCYHRRRRGPCVDRLVRHRGVALATALVWRVILGVTAVRRVSTHAHDTSRDSWCLAPSTTTPSYRIPICRPISGAALPRSPLPATLPTRSSIDYCSHSSTAFTVLRITQKRHLSSPAVSSPYVWVLSTRTNPPSVRTCTSTLQGQRGKRIRREKRRAAREPTPPRIVTPYGPIRILKPPRLCDTCVGRGQIRCPVCEGRGVIRSTGTRKHNALPQPNPATRLVGTRWTAVEIRRGQRHYLVRETRGSYAARSMHVRMENCCGDRESFWIPMQELRSKARWRQGWVTMAEIVQAEGGPLRDARLCFRCAGRQILSCVECQGVGSIPSYEPLHDV